MLITHLNLFVYVHVLRDISKIDIELHSRMFTDILPYICHMGLIMGMIFLLSLIVFGIM